jgi:osmotically-inducible protein OsmY
MNIKSNIKSVLACLIVLSLVACAGTPSRQSTGDFVDDTAITTKVKAALLADVALNAFRIHVRTNQDVVHLTGVVDSEQIRQRAGEVASKIDGVRSVQNGLTVR